MSVSNLSPYDGSNQSQAGSASGPSAQTSGQTQQSELSTFEAMLSTYVTQDKVSEPPPDLKFLTPPDSKSLTPPDPKSMAEQLQQPSLDLLPPQLRSAIKSMEQAPQPSAVEPPAVESPPVAQAPVKSSRITWSGGKLTETELQIVAVLNRHKDQCPLSWDSLTDKANDPSTPPDLKAAIEGLQKDPELFYAIGSQGDGRCGGKIKAGDLSGFSSYHSQVGAFQEQQAQNYQRNYIPSDGTGKGQPSVMTMNDAIRELYRYSEYLPKNLSQADFKQIVDGDAKIGKCPPQVIAAAQYFLNHPDAWTKLNGGWTGNVHKEDFLSIAASAMSLTKAERKTLDTINRNQRAFFGDPFMAFLGRGDLTREKLARMVGNKNLSKDVRNAASQLLSDPVLFGLLNNTITGYKTHHRFFDFGGGHRVDSGNISHGDFRHFYRNMSAANRTIQHTKTHKPKTAAEQDAAADMMMGVADQPGIKSVKKNGGALMHVVDGVLKVGSKVLDWAATAVGLLSFIPGLGELADLGSMVLEAESQAAKLLHTAITGGDMTKALKEAGLTMGAQALSLVAGPEVKLAMRNGLTKAALEEALSAGINLPVSMAQSYATQYLENVKARLEAGPIAAAGATTQFGMTPLQNVA
ncbi:nodulation outer protein X [Mesorhizobium amorphae]|uniref:HrpF/NolX family T3SS translocon protein n=1 Tax=Mesorhizobium amorphae TaxID=71433 RepID=UPI00235C9489|nr:HrpF/NolX family T3SS translocon protein [Mesorhizobium amorphae]GLR45950.1 nodulation outer protein X [Mesorhizobium amorphae]